jgi:hypothetical protein
MEGRHRGLGARARIEGSGSVKPGLYVGLNARRYPTKLVMLRSFGRELSVKACSACGDETACDSEAFAIASVTGPAKVFCNDCIDRREA